MSKLDTERMLKEVYELVGGDWGFSVTDDMVALPTDKYKKFTQEQAEEMANVIGKVFMISHCINCTACQGRYAKAVGRYRGKLV